MRLTLYDTKIEDDFLTSLVREKSFNYPIKNISHPEDLVQVMTDVFHLDCRGEEQVYMCTCNSKNKIIGLFFLSKGTVNTSLLNPREILLRALLCGAVSILLVHNHPSKDCTASSQDIAVTKRVKEAGKLIGIELLDHIIIGGTNYLSMKERGLM